jgi:uncharacterized protein (DUF2147 family)
MKYIASCVILLLPFAVFAQTSGDKIVGNWISEQGHAKFSIFKTGTTYSAKIIWLAQPLDKQGNPKQDKKNPDTKLQSRPVIGLEVFSGFTYTNNQWKGGKIYNPEQGLYADCKIEMPDANTLKIIASKGFFSITKQWKRI